MTFEEMLTHIDHTNLKPIAKFEDMERLCEEAMALHCASVCIPPSYVRKVDAKYGKSLNICTVIGFPLGYSTTVAKVAETKRALDDGANEIDMVINIGDVKNGDFDRVSNEVNSIKKECLNKVLKVIIETCYLTDKEKIRLCRVVTEAGAEYIKTSTGFGSAGADLKDIALFKENIGGAVKIKAAGGIRNLDSLKSFIEAGCDRVGCSSTMDIVQEMIKLKGPLHL